MMTDFQKKLTRRRADNAFRTLSDKGDLIDFSSNNYLGLERYIDHQKMSQEINRSGSRLLSGETNYKSSVEGEIARHHQAEAALIFSSGYSANLGLMSCIGGRGDTILFDALSHASIRDGLKLSQAKDLKFAHNDLEDLEHKLSRAEGSAFVVIESVYSMDGDGPDLKSVSTLCQKYGAHLIVDEAHSAGVYGLYGAGLCIEAGIADQVFARIITYGKAFGFHGAAVLGSKDLRDYLINFSRPFIYSTAPSNQFFREIEIRYAILKERPEISNEFHEKKAHLESSAEKLQLNLGGGMSGIYTYVCPGNELVKKLGNYLQEAGFDVRPILSPTVPAGSERLRICLHAYNSKAEIDGLLKNLKNYEA